MRRREERLSLFCLGARIIQAQGYNGEAINVGFGRLEMPEISSLSALAAWRVSSCFQYCPDVHVRCRVTHFRYKLWNLLW